jgi:hypothetical protein
MVDFTGHAVTSRIKVKPITLDHMVSSKRMERLVIIKFLLVGRMIHPREVIGREDHWRRRHHYASEKLSNQGPRLIARSLASLPSHVRLDVSGSLHHSCTSSSVRPVSRMIRWPLK